MASDLKIWSVVYMGGSCGDLVTAMIDPKHTKFDWVFKKMVLSMDRQQLKKPFMFDNNAQKTAYLDAMAKIYDSVPSHDIEYHVDQAHDFIGIRVQDKDVAHWAADRFKHVHRPEVWKTVCDGWKISSIDQYAQLLTDYGQMIQQRTSHLLDLEDIVSGKVIQKLQDIIDRDLTEGAVNLYRNWQSIQKGTWLS